MSVAALIVMTGFWPFGRAPDTDTATVGDAGPLVSEASAPPPPGDPAAAAEAYAAFLASPAAADPAMRLTALRRLADLRLEAAELALMDGASPQARLDKLVGARFLDPI
ncbi:MAG TPA: hypothetical protein PLS34_05610, partial [Gammaproteobacteria bacterium]|nr:hypothetical protein [Gammaproteobacteria bacterium]